MHGSLSWAQSDIPQHPSPTRKHAVSTELLFKGNAINLLHNLVLKNLKSTSISTLRPHTHLYFILSVLNQTYMNRWNKIQSSISGPYVVLHLHPASKKTPPMIVFPKARYQRLFSVYNALFNNLTASKKQVCTNIKMNKCYRPQLRRKWTHVYGVFFCVWVK